MGRRVTIGLYVVLHVVIGLVLVSSATNPLLGIGLLILSGFFSTLLHEMGHAIGALCVGWRVVVFSVHRAAWHLKNREMAWLPEDALHEAAGFVFGMPSATANNTFQRHAVFIAGGPIASLLQAIAGVGVAVWLPNWLQFGPIYVAAAAFGIGVQGLAVFLSTIIPRTEPRSNDGQMLLDVYRASKAGEPAPAVGWLVVLLKHNVRLKDLPQWMVDEAGAHPEQSPEYHRWFDGLVIGRVLDREPVDASRARALIDAYYEQYPPNDWLRACDAFLAAIYERDLARANTLVEQIDDPLAPLELALAARAATAMLAGDAEAADLLLCRMDDALNGKSPYRDLTFRDIRGRIEAIQPASVHDAAATVTAGE